MIETIFAIVAAIITICSVQFLIHRQNIFRKHLNEELDEARNEVDKIVQDVAILTGEEPEEHKLAFLERRLALFNERLNNARNSIKNDEKRDRNDGRKQRKRKKGSRSY